MNEDEGKLKACPSCGGRAIMDVGGVYRQGARIFCENPKCRVTAVVMKASNLAEAEVEVMISWNRRNPAKTSAIEALHGAGLVKPEDCIMVSKCCAAPMHVTGKTTLHYVCKECGLPCDPVVPPAKDEGICTCPHGLMRTLVKKSGMPHCPRCGKPTATADEKKKPYDYEVPDRYDIGDEGTEPCVNFSTSPPCGAIAPCDSTTAVEDKCDSYIRADLPTAPTDEGEEKHQPDCSCHLCAYDKGKNIGRIEMETRAGKVIATLQAALAEKEKEVAKLKETEEGYANALDDSVEIHEELQKRIEELEAEAKESDAGFKRIVDNDRAKDEVHCGCCVELRLQVEKDKKRIEESENDGVEMSHWLSQQIFELCDKLKLSEAVVDAANQLDISPCPEGCGIIQYEDDGSLKAALSAHDKGKQEPEERRQG